MAYQLTLADLSADIKAMASAASPVVKAVANLLTDVIALKGGADVLEYVLPDPRHLYFNPANEPFRLQQAIVISKQSLSNPKAVGVAVTDQRQYFVLTEMNNSTAVAVYQGLRKLENKKWAVAWNTMALVIDMTNRQLVAQPVVLLKELDDSNWNGKVCHQMITLCNLELYQQEVNRVVSALNGDYFHFGPEKIFPAYEARRESCTDIPMF